MKNNLLKKWHALLAIRPPVVRLVGPCGYSRVLAATYPVENGAELALLD